MSERGFHRLLVTEGEDVCGIVSSLDLVRLLGERGLAPA
jgi:CBS domain-containing protein